MWVADSRLGSQRLSTYGGRVIGLLRFLGLLNTAVWLGMASFGILGVLPVLGSSTVLALLGQNYFPYLSVAIGQALMARLFHWQIFFALMAWLHLVLEWLYLGRLPRRLWVIWLTWLFALTLAGGLWLSPKLLRLNRTQHALNVRPEIRAQAGTSFRRWDGFFQAVNVLLLGGVAVYFWRLTTAEDAPRFVAPVKFRS